MFMLRFPSLRLTALALALLAQAYLFVCIRRAIRSSGRSARFQRWTIRLVGTTIGLLYALNTYILFRAIPWVDPPLAAQTVFFYLAAVWNFGSLFSGLFLMTVQLGGTLIRATLWFTQRWRNRIPSAPVDPARRRLLQAGVGSLAAAPVMLSGYGAAYAARAYDIRELVLPFGRALRVVQLTDIHAGLYMTREQIRRYTERVIRLQPDLFVLTGDFISNSMAFLPGCVEEMARVRARFGTFATLGNHEHMYGMVHDVEAVFRDRGIPLLTNAHRIIMTGQGPFAVVGIDDLQRGLADLEAALQGLDPAIPRLLLSHRPEIFPEAAELGIPLTLAGHWHGGQVKLALPGCTISIAHFRTPYPEGLYRIEGSHLYVSRGIGTTATPVRLNAPPEITVVNLV